MVHLGTRRDVSVLCMVLVLAAFFRGSECKCTVDCQGSGGKPDGNFCLFEPPEEQKNGTTIVELHFSSACVETITLENGQVDTGWREYLELVEETNITMKKILDYDVNPNDLNYDFFVDVQCDSTTCTNGSLIIKFQNINDNPIMVNSTNRIAEVYEIIAYNTNAPIEVNPKIVASDGDVESWLSYTIEDTQSDFKLVESFESGEPVCFPTFVNGEINTQSPILVVKEDETSFNYMDDSSIQLSILVQSFMDNNQCSDGAVENTTILLSVNIVDIDDQPPIFNDTVYDCVTEEASLEFIRPPNIYAFDQDEGINVDISYSLKKQDNEWDCSSYVSIDKTSGAVSILKEFNFEEHEICKLLLTGTQNSTSKKIATASLEIVILDVNDNCPKTEASSTQGKYIEGDSFVSDDISQDWLRLEVADADTILTYTDVYMDSAFFALQNFNCSGLCFRISPNESNIENLESENVTVFVEDTLSNSTLCLVWEVIEIIIPQTAEILNPTIALPDDNAEIEENETGVLVKVTALNGDGTEDGIEYSLPDQEYDVFFSINETGYIHVESPLDYETKSTYFITVKATDGRWTDIERSSTAVVNVTVIDVNDNNPVLEGFPLLLYVSEGTPPNTVIITLVATDRDADSNITYSFETTPAKFPFTIDPFTGEISTTGPLDADAEDERQYKATVSASDGENKTPFEDLIITILDVNDNPPIISTNTQFVFDINENDNGPKTFLVNVTDDDYLDENKDYNLTSDGGSNVTIDQIAGEIKVFGPFDREVMGDFRFTLTAINTAEPALKTSQDVIVRILDLNDEIPTFTSETERYCSEFTITEGDIPIKPLCTFSATDDDEMGSLNAQITYEIDDSEHSEYFEMNSITGELTLKDAFDREAVSNITITVTASDNGPMQNSDSMVVDITIDGVNDNRPFFKSDGNYSITVYEETTPNTLILIITAVDVDVPSPDPIYYRPVDDSDQVWETFYLKSENGKCEIYLKSALSYSETPYELEIETYDGSGREGPHNSTTVTVEVEPRIPCNININEEYSQSISESDLSNFETIVDVDASSSCSESEEGIIYNIEEQILRPVEGGETESSFLSINESSGEIYAMNATNVQIGMYVLTVTAQNETGSDIDQNQDSVQVFVNVTDVNNRCPYFEESQYFARYTEGDLYLSSFNSPEWLVVTAFDDDTEFEGEVVFSDDTTFAENTTELSSKRSFRIAVIDDVPSDMTLNITVSDETAVEACELRLTTVYITVEEYLSPVFLNDTYSTTLDENPKVGDSVIQVTAQNEDGTMQDISYAIKSPSNTPFMIDVVSGEIVVAFEGIDYETVKEYNLTVSATDNRWNVKRSSVTQVLIEIEDVNEFSPVLLGLPATIKVQESVEIGSEVFILKGNDGDIDDNDKLLYMLMGGGENKFAVNETSGSVYTTGKIDFDIGETEYFLEVSVSDGDFESSSQLTINIQDVNDNVPVFDPVSYKENIRENQSPSYINVEASDRDEMDIISYNISGKYPDGASVNDTGVVTFPQIFDREQQGFYSFFVIASDGTFETSAEIEITVMDENDETPQFVNLCDGNVQIEEDEPDFFLVCKISAEDADAPGSFNSMITYTLLDDGGGPFYMNSSSGEIVLIDTLNYEDNTNFTLIFQAGDGINGFENTVNGSLEVSVIDVNDNPPIFEAHPSTISLIFDLTAGSEVRKLLVNDGDSPPFDAFRCLETDSNDASWDTFYVTTVKDGCSVILGTSLNTSIDYTIRVTAVDFNDDSLTDSTEFLVIVTNTYPCEISLEVDDVIYNKTDVASGDTVADVQATSNCSDSEDGVVFTILRQQLTSPLGDKNELSEEFKIAENNGTIYYAGSDEYPSVGEHLLLIEAVNGSDDAVRAQTQLKITIEDVDVSDPEFPDPPQIPDNPDPSSTSVFVGRFDDGDEYVFNYDDTSKLVITAIDGDTCFSGNVKVLDPPSTPFYLEEQSRDLCMESYEAFLRVNGTVDDIPNITTFQIILFDGENIEIGVGNVTVQRVNLSPVFQDYPAATVRENAFVGDNVTEVLALNNDGTSDGIQYEIASQTFFELKDAESGVITVASVGIDYESTVYYNISLSAHDTRWSPWRTTTTIIGVDVIDVNEYPPRLSPFPSIIIQENVALAGETIYKIQAFDSDASSTLEYNVVNYTDIFEVDKESGDVTLLSSIDAETDPLSYYVHVNVTDGTYVNSDVLVVKITDFNEFPPNITGKPVVEMYEDETFASTQVTAFDPDVSRLPILYSINPSDSIASIDDNGNITFQGKLNYAEQSSYSFIVMAMEDGTEGLFSSTFEVTVEVLDINDHDPELVLEDCFPRGLTEVVVLEGPEGKQEICSLSATDQDAETETSFTYFLLNNYEDTFELDASTGKLSVVDELDREEQDKYNLEVLVNDGGNPSRNSSITTITVTVGDVNDEPPKFDSLPALHFSVVEGSEAGTFVAELTVMDDDAFPYNISRCEKTNPADPVWNNFTIINDRVGFCDIITLAVLFGPSSYTLGVTAIDQDREDLSGSITLKVLVITDDDCQLTITLDSPLDFDEDQLVAGSQVTRANISSLCSDSLDEVAFEISEQTLQHPNGIEEDVSVFDIDDIGVISVMSSANVSLGQYTLIVSAENTSMPMSRDTDELLITINDINNNCPGFLSNEDAGIYAQNDQFIYEVESTDRLVIIADDPDLEFIGTFTVNSTDINVEETKTSGGTLELEFSIDSALSGNVTIQVTVVDETISCLSDVITIYIYEIPVQELSPIFLDPDSYSGEVWENATADTYVTQVTAEDYKGNTSGITYKFEEEDNQFRIDAKTGVITTGVQDLDYETKNNYLKSVIASDEKWNPPRISEIFVVIDVLDIDEYQLQLAQIPPLNVTENSKKGSLVYKASATDADGSSNLLFSLEDATNKFYIDPKSGEIFTTSTLNAEDSDHYIITVTVTDETSSLSESQIVQVFISDVNDWPPQFDASEYSEEVPENFEGIRWFMVNATDGDLTSDNNIISYSLQDADDNRFSIDDRGNVTIDTEGNVFNRELQALYEFRVIARDNGNPSLSTSAKVSVNVSDVNEEPLFPQPLLTEFEFLEGETGLIGTFQATDNDEGPNGEIEYSLETEDEKSEGLFSINYNGELRVVKPLDRENKPSHSLNIYATDSGSPPLNTTIHVTITVLDKNDNAPVFWPPFETIADASLRVGSEIFQLSATDEDEYPNDVIVFTPGNSSSDVWKIFTLQANDVGATILLISEFDVEFTQTYNFDVKASNPDGEQMETLQEYTVVVNDGTLCFVTVELPSGDTVKTIQGDFQQDEVFLQLNATSSEGCDEDDEFIFVLNSQMYSSFEDEEFVDVTTFELSAEGELSPNVASVDTGEYLLVVAAFNKSNPDEQLSIPESLLTILVVGDENSAPYFDEEQSRNIRLPKVMDELLFILEARDPDDDSSGNNQLVFEEISETNLGGETNYFRVNADGKVFADSNLLSNDLVDFTVQVTDSGVPPLSNVTTVQIKLTMDAAPILNRQCEPEVFIMENSAQETLVCEVESTGEEDVLFSLTSGNAKFVIDEYGSITTNDTFDYEERQDYQIIVNAEGLDSKLTSTTQFVVKITDINDNPPHFSNNYSFVLLEDSGSINCDFDFGVVVAIDGDGSENNSFTTYSLEGDDRFKVDAMGVISKTECIDVETSPGDTEIVLILRAENSRADPVLHDTADVNITIRDINDNPPVLSLNGDQEIIRDDFIEQELLFDFNYTDNDISERNRESFYSFELNKQGALEYFEFDEEGGTISTSTTAPPIGTDFSIEVIISNTAEPKLSSSMTVFYSYTTGSYFPKELQVQSVNVVENNVGTVETDVPGPSGSLPASQYSVFYMNGSCAENIKAEYKSETFLKLSTTALDFEVPGNRIFNITIAFASEDDKCADVRRKKRQVNVLANGDSSLVTITLVNINDEPPSFTGFSLGNDSPNYYQAIHVSRVVGATVYDLSQDAGKVNDLDEMPKTLTYAETEESDLVDVTSDGPVVLKKLLSKSDADGSTHDVTVQVLDSEQGGSDEATLRLRVMADDDIFMLGFNWDTDSKDEEILQCVENCFPEHIHVFKERVIKSESGQDSVLWLYAVTEEDVEDFMTKQEFVEIWGTNDCSNKCSTVNRGKIGWTSVQIAVFILAVLLLVGTIIFILLLLCSFRIYEQERERRMDIQEAPPSTESEDSFRPVVSEVPLARGESIFDKIAREKNTTLYGSDEAIIELMSEADGLSVDGIGGKLVLDVSPEEKGELEVKETEEETEKDDDDDDIVDPYSTFHFDPEQKNKNPSKESGKVVLNEATVNSETSMLDDILAEYDNKGFELDEKSPSKITEGALQPPGVEVGNDESSPRVSIQHGGGETSTDALILQKDEKSQLENGPTSGLGSTTALTQAGKEASDEAHVVDDTNSSVTLKDINNDSKTQGDHTAGQSSILDGSLPVTSL